MRSSVTQQASSFSWLLLVVLLAQVTLFGQVQSAKVDKYDPANEGLFDRVTRGVLRTLLSRDDATITAGRLANEATVHPTFHPAVKVLDDDAAIDDILAMPAPPARRPGLDDSGDDLPWQIRANRESSEEREKQWKVWVVLATAPQSDPLSRSLNAIFNDTLGMIFPDGDGASTASENEIHEKSIQKASKYKYAVADFDEVPDLMWRWWIWKVPVVLFITPSTSPSRTYDIRYWKVAFTQGLNPEKILTYIGHDVWLERLDVWTSALAPGGERSHLPLRLSRPSNWIYDKFSAIPTWIIGMLMAGFGTTMIKWLHAGQQTGDDKKKEDGAQASADPAKGTSSAIDAKKPGSSTAQTSKKSS